MLRPSANHGTQPLPNDDDDDVPIIEWPKSNLVQVRKVAPDQGANAHCILTL